MFVQTEVLREIETESILRVGVQKLGYVALKFPHHVLRYPQFDVLFGAIAPRLPDDKRPPLVSNSWQHMSPFFGMAAELAKSLAWWSVGRSAPLTHDP